MKYSNFSGVIDALTCQVVETSAGWKPAADLGGRTSRSGLTIWPEWIEAGAIPAYREDSLPEQLPERLVLFSGHGTNPENIRELSRERFIDALAMWTAWRDDGGVGLHDAAPPACTCEEDFLGKRRSRTTTGNADTLTHGEAIRGLLARAGADATAVLDIEDTPDEDGQVRWDLTVSDSFGPRFRAYGFAAQGQTPVRWKCSQEGAQTSWDEATPAGVVRHFNTFHAADDRWEKRSISMASEGEIK